MQLVQFGINYTSELHEGKLSPIVLGVSLLVSLTIAKFMFKLKSIKTFTEAIHGIFDNLTVFIQGGQWIYVRIQGQNV